MHSTRIWWLAWPWAKCIKVYLQKPLAELFCDKRAPSVVNCQGATVAPIIQHISFDSKKKKQTNQPQEILVLQFCLLVTLNKQSKHLLISPRITSWRVSSGRKFQFGSWKLSSWNCSNVYTHLEELCYKVLGKLFPFAITISLIWTL